MKAIFVSLALVLLVFVAVSAAGSGGPPLTALDSTGARVELAAPARRVVALAPGAVESLFAFGAGGSLAAVGTNCDYPPEAAGLPRLEPSLPAEALSGRLAALGADLLIVEAPPAGGERGRLASAGIGVFVWRPADFVGLARCIMAAGVLVGRPDPAVRAAATLTQAVGRLRIVTDALHSEDRPRVAWLAPGGELRVYGRSSLATAFIEAAGGVNVFRDREALSFAVGGDEIRARAPAIVVASRSGSDAGRLEADAFLAALPPESRFILDEALSTRAGPRSALGLLSLAKRFHPERFP
jgi:ABC-type Fe3+-hydroxamate transport system substrate-binding protein